MTRDRLDCPDLGVAGGRHLKVHLAIQHELRERTKPQFAVRRSRRIAIESHTMPDAMRTVGESVADQLKIGRSLA